MDGAQTILQAGIFDPGCYCPAAGLAPDTDLAAAVSHYLQQGEAAGLPPHDLFDPAHVRRQLEARGIALVEGSALVTYLLHPELDVGPHPLFDHALYARADARLTDLEDYVRRRAAGPLPPSPSLLFDRAFYYERNPDVAARNADALAHYVRGGWKEGRQPHALFDASYWSRMVAAGSMHPVEGNPLVRYCTDPTTWSVPTHPLFDPRFLEKELAAAGLARDARQPPLAQLLATGPALAGNRLFDPGFYALQARLAGVALDEHPLAHYAARKGGGRLDPHPLFSDAYYSGRYPDVASAPGTPLEHFLAQGEAEGRDPNPLFSVAYYRSANQLSGVAVGRAFEHYLEGGPALLDTHALFDARAYAARHPDCLQEGQTPLGHLRRAWTERGVRFPVWGTALTPRRRDPEPLRGPDVVLVSHDLTRTGAPLILLAILQHLVQRHGLRVLVLASRGGELLEDFCEWADTIELALARRAGTTEEDFIRAIRAALAPRLSPRLVIVNTACIDHLAESLAGDAPVMTLVHELASGFPEKSFRNIYANSGVVVYPAQFVRNEAHVRFDLPAEKSLVLPQGLLRPQFGRADPASARRDLRAEIGAADDAFIVLGCGTTDLRKGLDTFVLGAIATLRAARAREGGRPVHFVWVGAGLAGPQTVDWFARQDIDRSALAGRIHLLGPRTDTEPYFQGADAFAMTSRMDPFPCVVHEAMACALPVVAFADAGGAAEALGEDAGVMVEYGDIPQMAQRILELRDDPERARAIGTRARETVRRRYGFADYVDRILAAARERLGARLPDGAPAAAVAPPARRVVVTLGDADSQRAATFSRWLVAGLVERGLDAELLYTGNPAPWLAPGGERHPPARQLLAAHGQKLTCKDQWGALSRVLDVARPAILVHNCDVIGSSCAPLAAPGTGILGVIRDASQAELEQAARLGRYWQRALLTRPGLEAAVLEAAPQLAGRTVRVDWPSWRRSAPEPRPAGAPLKVLVCGAHPHAGSAMPFLLPLLHEVRAAGIAAELTFLSPGPEGRLLRLAAAEPSAGLSVRVAQGEQEAGVQGLFAGHEVFVDAGAEGSGDGPRAADALRSGMAVIELSWRAASPVSDGVNGFRLAPAGPAECAARLRELARSPGLLDRMRAAAWRTGGEPPGPDDDPLDAIARLLSEMIAEIESGRYRKPAPVYQHELLGALSLPPGFMVDAAALGYAAKR